MLYTIASKLHLNVIVVLTCGVIIFGVHIAPSWYSICKFPFAKKGGFCTPPKLEYLK